jgi:fructokinase
MTVRPPVLAGVELGGTKCICVLGTGPDEIMRSERVATGHPDVTLGEISEILHRWRSEYGPPAALGISSFGPLELRPSAPTYGTIRSSVKRGWQDVPLLARLSEGWAIPVGLNTDVNGAALAEARWGAGRGLADFAYVTVGTGIGVSLVVGGSLAGGCSHSELGHIRVARAPSDTWPGVCPYHGDCVEGLASGPAIAARSGAPAADLASDAVEWRLAAHALGQLMHVITFATVPERILVGGGVAEGRPEILAYTRDALVKSINGFVDLESLVGDVSAFVIPPGLGALAGPLGALAVAAEALEHATASDHVAAGRRDLRGEGSRG